jgi:DNA-binding SARP family transcriptional activator
MALLKVLLCRPNRRASRDELIEAIWLNHETINAAHALESAASVLRRHILCTGEAGNLLLTAEELLFATLEEDPTDEDALCRLMVLLVEQERRQEAPHLYQYAEDVLREEQAEPAVYTRELARRIRQGLVLRERGSRYTAARVQALSLVQRNAGSRDHRDNPDVKGARATITTGCGGQTTSPYHYCLPRRRSRRQVALPG